MAVLTALLGLAASAAHGGPPSHPAHPRISQQATATVHIVAGVRIEHGKPPESAMLRQTVVRDTQGDRRAARLIEFP